MAQPTAKTIPSRFSIVPVKFAFTAGTTGETLVDWMPGDIAIFHNEHASLAKTFTVVSKPKAKRADYTITAFSLAADEYAVCPRFGPQDEEVLSVTCESTDIKMARISTAPQPA